MLAGGRKPGPFRAWVAGCATGEEAFSVAIILKELLEANDVARQLLIFGTDIDGQAIEKARHGAYPQNIVADVGPERLKRFFINEHNHYRVSREIRDSVVFAEQNILRDPPFSNLDLLVCRNLLIYLKTEAQNKLFPLFHYTLEEGGILFLGNSESVSRHPELFKIVNKTFSIYRKKNGGVRPPVEFRSWAREFKAVDEDLRPTGRHGGEAGTPSIAQVVEKELMRDFSPACVIVNQSGEILHIHGRTGNYLEPAPGRPNMQIADMAREGLRIALMRALRRAAEQKNREVRERGLRVKTDGEDRLVDLTVRRIEGFPLKGCLMVVFEEPPLPMHEREGRNRRADTSESSRPHNAELEQELVRVRQDYRSAMEELETSNEELRSVNEEMYSSNEELQSTNEELESSREELQSLNEELNTVNSELHGKIVELKETQAAITSVLNSTRIAIVFLDNDLRVKRFTEETARLINLIESDIGRPIGHISFNLDYENLPRKIRQVLQDLTAVEEEVRTRDGYWYRMRIMVHRTAENTIAGGRADLR
ncbi:MAG: CheR family methyltransferase [Desulfobacterales bacterium]